MLCIFRGDLEYDVNLRISTLRGAGLELCQAKLQITGDFRLLRWSRWF